MSLLFIGLLIFGATAFLDLFNIAKDFLNPTKEEPRMFNQGGQTKNKKKKNNKTKKMI